MLNRRAFLLGAASTTAPVAAAPLIVPLAPRYAAGIGGVGSEAMAILQAASRVALRRMIDELELDVLTTGIAAWREHNGITIERISPWDMFLPVPPIEDG